MSAVSPLEVARIQGGHTCLDKSPLSWKEKVAYLAYCLESEGPAAAPLSHIFQPAVYVREMFIPAGKVFIGRSHRRGHLCELVEGSVLWMTEQGRKQVDAPFRVHTTPGYNMVLYTITDILGRTYHPNPLEETDVKILEDEYFESPEALKALGAEVAPRAQALGLRAGNLLRYAL